MNKKFLVILIVLSLATFACSAVTFNVNPLQYVQGSGKVVSEPRAVSGFSAISLQGSGDVDVAFGDSESAVVEADDNIVPLIETSVQNGRLVISTKNYTNYRTNNPVHIHVTMKALDEIRLSGSGNINVPDLSGDSLLVSLPGSGNITVDGTANNVDATVSGSGNVDCSGLKAKSASAKISGSGNIQVYASSSLDASISGSGTIQYSGSPASVTKNVSGSGNIIP
jgi:hypothetical protein